MDSFPTTFTASIETVEGKSFQHPWHLGTQEPMARRCVEDIYRGRVMSHNPVLTIALKFDGKIVDVFDGKEWQSDALDRAQAEMYEEWA
jgi:hypothetical protein